MTLEPMRTTTNLSITLPPEMLESFQKLAKAENRTMSELVREALRNYEKQRRRELIAEARERAGEQGIKEEDVVRIIREYRREEREKNKARS
ncbi:MAG TPA: ribbon-helix-helix domain-containing protein [Bryobacteraceae bacterium]|nr:ribbon-helix-helix domain-containing protein [Bryobacteraceae bacterium]